MRWTTAPGVIARSLPTSKALGSTIAGIRGGAARSVTKDRMPRTADMPPVSMSAFQPAGDRTGLLLGAAAATRLVAKNRIRSPSRQSSSAVDSSESAA